MATNFRSGSGYSTRIGFVNCNDQKNHGTRHLDGNDHNQVSYKLECQRCRYCYGANGSDIHLRKCPNCQGGAPGLAY